MMLQQTQVDRVIPKYKAFLAAFPTVYKLGEASNVDVLALWSGLGYNRRALYLKRTAEALVEKYHGVFPKDIETLESLPGIGPYTARAVATFSYNQPYTCIETNIRAVFIREFFPDTTKVADSALLPLIEKTLDKTNPREWYYALMDYGTYIKKQFPNPSRASLHHVKQSTFVGSVREVRGAILRKCLAEGKVAESAVYTAYSKKDISRIQKAIAGLVRDGVIALDKKGIITII